MLFFNYLKRGIPEAPYITYDVYYPYKLFNAVRFIQQNVDEVNAISEYDIITKWSPVIESDIGHIVPRMALIALARTLELQVRFNKSNVPSNTTVQQYALQRYALPVIRKIFGEYSTYIDIDKIKPMYVETISIESLDYNVESDLKIITDIVLSMGKIHGNNGILIWFHDDCITLFK
jgi:hypothetical protein